jgi:NAD(P)H-quinone oxidoreductase subunit 2
MPDMSSLLNALNAGVQTTIHSYIFPEVILTIGLLVTLIATVYHGKKTDEYHAETKVGALIFVLLSLGALAWNFQQNPPSSPETVLFGAMTADLFGVLMRMMLLVGAAITIAISHRFLELNTRIIGDFYVLVMGATLGGMFLASANDMILVFVALETLSITSYILAGYLRKTVRSAEASFKYLIYGGMGTAVFLFGLSLVYGLVGATGFREISAALVQYQGVAHPTLVVMLLMIVAALAFKLSTAPFHMWTPDVYEGAPTPVAAFLSVVSKTAAFALTVRLFVMFFAGFPQMQLLFVILAVLSMTIGNFVALKQTNIKRLLAYSTIAHAGYMILGLAVGSVAAIGSMIYYLIAYLFMNMGAFASVIAFHNMTRSDEIKSYSGLIQKRPWLVLGFSFCLLSLTGIPITAGFFAKFFLFQTLIQSGSVYLWLVLIALVNSTISIAYYLNVIRLMVVKEPSSAVQAMPETSDASADLATSLAVSVAATLLLGIFASPFFEFSKTSVEQLFQQRSVAISQAQLPAGK